MRGMILSTRFNSLRFYGGFKCLIYDLQTNSKNTPPPPKTYTSKTGEWLDRWNEERLPRWR